MEIKLSHNLTSDDLLKDIKWYGDTDLDDAAEKKLEELGELLTETVQKIFFLHLETDRIATNQGSSSARRISNEAKLILHNVVNMATPEEDWDDIEEIFSNDFSADRE